MKRDPKDQKELESFIVSQGGKKYIQKIQSQLSGNNSEKTEKDAHGTKLQYVKTLKNICADDEELVYYKVGGKVGCGCKKKEVDINKAKCGSSVDKFKKAKKMQSGDRMMQLAQVNKERKKKLENQKKKKGTWSETTKYYADKNATYKEPKQQDSAVRDRKENPENKKKFGGPINRFKMRKYLQGE